MELLIQPGSGTGALIEAIDRARRSVDIVIFRFDSFDVEQAMERALSRGVMVHALIAFTNRGGEKNLRKLETRLLGRGITVSRTADDLVRYHGKMLIIDRSLLLLLAFNFTHLDIDQSRSFGLITRDRELVREAVRLFEADSLRQPYSEGSERFLVSPVNARERLEKFIAGAHKQLLIYDVDIADRKMLAQLRQRVAAGVDVRIVGSASGRGPALAVRPLADLRLHARAMVRDRRDVFLGSQSLRPLELDARREIGAIVHSPKLAAAVARQFEADWKHAEAAAEARANFGKDLDPEKAVKKMAKAISKSLPPAPALAKAVQQAIAHQVSGPIDEDDVEETVRGAVKEAVRDAVHQVVKTVVEQEVTEKTA